MNLFWRIFKSFLQAPNGMGVKESLDAAKDAVAHFGDVVSKDLEPCVEVILHAAIRNPYLCGIANAGVKTLVEWALKEAIEHADAWIDHQVAMDQQG